MTLHLAEGLDLPDDAVTETFAILAKRGAGKSNAAVVMAEQMFDAGLPWVAIDPKGDWWGIRSSGDGKGPGLPVLVLGGEHGDVPLEPTAAAVVADLLVENRLTAVVDVSLMLQDSKAAARRFLTDLAKRLYKVNREPLHIFAEEAHEYIPQRVDSGSAPMVGAWETLVKWGRTHGLGVTLITQRSASLNKDVLTQVETLIALRTTGPQDQAAIRAWVDQHESGAAMIAQLRKLTNGEAYVLSPQWLELDEPLRVTFNRRRTFDSGATPKAGQTRTVPKTLAEIDVPALKGAIAETIERAKADDPAQLRKRIRDLERELVEERVRPRPEPVVKRIEVPVPEEALVVRLGLHLEDLKSQGAHLVDVAEIILGQLHPRNPQQERNEGSSPTRSSAPGATHPDARPVARGRQVAPTTQERPAAGQRETRPAPAAGTHLRKGARRMVESLGRMAPLRLTTGQWGMVAHLKTTGGTWSTYLSELRRADLVEQDSAGWTLTDAGFDYIGGRPDPMTAGELQAHYRSILRAGAVRMLDALIDAHPDGLTIDELGADAGIATTGGTFSTYLGELTRNGLAVRDTDGVTATEILMYGADAR